VQIVVWIVSAIASAFIGLLLTVLFQDAITDTLALLLRPLVPLRRGRDISGKWITYWSVVPEAASSSTAARPSTEITVIRLRRIGNRIIGTDATKKRHYAISARLQDGKFLTGIWRDYSNGRYQWGGFQLCWRDSGSGMVGKFIGKDSQNHINHGLWFWSRPESDLAALVTWADKEGRYEFDVTAFKRGIKTALSGRSERT
jgi:hypothetical protein